MFRHRILLTPLFCLLAMAMLAQSNAESVVREADRHFEQMAYARAIEGYRYAADMGAINDHVTRRLAESHMMLGNTEEAERWYSTVVKFLNREPRDLFNYAQALKSNGRYSEAEEWMDLYLATVDPDGQERSNISGFAKKFIQDLDRFRIWPVTINTEFSDFGPAWLGNDQVIFTSSRNETVGIERRAAWNDQPFLDLFVANVTPDGDLVDARPLPGSVNTRFHEGPATASSNGDVLWFTRNNYHKGRSKKSSQGISRLSLFKAYQHMGKWSGVEEFLYNNSEVSIGHPALSSDGNTLYFVSDMPGGIGGTDIYVCHLQDGQWSEPKNLGPSVNTPMNEVFPFIGNDGTLYFSSDGHPGLGGLDIFAAAPLNKGGFRPAMNVGAPVNGPKDDFRFIIDQDNRRGYFSSNRPSGKGDDDIYGFEMFYPLEERYLVTGIVIDDEYDIPVIGADVTLYDLDGKMMASGSTDGRGEYAFPVEKNSLYRVVAKMAGRHEAQKHLDTKNIERTQIISRDLRLLAEQGILLRGAVKEKDGKGFIEGMTVSLVNTSSFHSETQQTGESGDLRFRLQPNEEFEVHFEKEGYFSQSVPISTAGMKQGVIDLNSVRDLAFENVEVGRPIPFKYVNWKDGRANLDPVAKAELELLVERMIVNPRIEIEIAVHSDARGNANEKLKQTQKQADTIMEYLRNKGVPKDRMSAKGYGSTQVLNHCLPGISCSDEEHAVNRRSEYTVVRIRE